MVVVGTYDFELVALSFAVACLASYTALDLATRIRASSGWIRSTWLATAAVAMGGGIWSMHFIAMLAFIMPMPMTYDIGLTALSLFVAIGVTGVGFYVIATRRASVLQLALSGLFMGIGIVAMHYSGMAAMRMPAELRYNHLLVALSVLIAVGASIAALWLTFRTAAVWQRLMAAIVMGIAISGMHYTGMAAAIFTAHSETDELHGASGLAETNLALAIGGITFLILIIALIASAFDRQFATLAERETVLLRESEEQYRRLYRETPLPLHSLGRDDRIEKASDAWLDLLGYAPAEAIGRKITDFMTQNSKQRYQQMNWPSSQAGGEIRQVEFQFIRKTGEVLDVLLSARLELKDGKPLRTLAGLVDITARKRAEEALRHSQRIDAIGQLTGGVAHDFNNLLMVISGGAEKLKRTTNDPNTGPSLEMISTAVKRGQKLTGQLLSFARRQTLATAVIDIAGILPNVGEMLKRSLRGDIEIKIMGQDCACRARVDPGELELALLNLGVNARDAMPDGGILSVSVRKVELYGGIDADGLRGEFVVIELKDTGTGIPSEILPRVFDPFFTTKGVGKGTGLGLSQVYGFAKQSNGTVTVRSTPGHGTTVEIYLPATDDPVHAAQDDMVIEDKPQSGNGIVLLVEDNDEVAAVSAQFLEQLGYSVDHAPNGSSALQKLQKRRSYVFVFSDILMPGNIGGLELARIVRQHHRDIPILLTTGYSDKAQEAVREGLLVVQKPFDVRRLSEAIEQLRSNPTNCG
jgi:PAS domain S-box-containing protein